MLKRLCKTASNSHRISDNTSGKKSEKQPLAVWQCITGWYGEDFDGQSDRQR